ncbi:MAG TPA: hypothetical protein VK147_12090 [Candidatus Didemnitutus sp.]|nr:hypothetical protein [Candidatus Didemnitutus sp.]
MKTLLITILLILAVARGIAQDHDHHNHAMADTTMPAMDPSTMMTSSTSLSLPMTRNGSGTGWQPDASPMYAIMNHDLGGWQLMLHGSLFLRQTWVNINNKDKRSDAKFDAPNYVMAMAQRKIGENGLLSLQAMISLDPLTVGGAGYPLLFQTGESWEGKPLVDHQHPHDLFASLAIAYTQRMNEDVDLTAYLGYPGEPALGPTAFMHRASSIANPDAPLGHHWLDATHIVFGVGTLGVRVGQFKAEGSIFTGREPDENRYDFDKPLFDSYSWRVSWAPSRNITAQVSQGYINQPEFGSTADVIRTTASMQFAAGTTDAWWSGMIAGGHNNAGHGHEEFAVLAETAVDINGTVPYLRAEWVQKSREELAIEGEGAHGIIEDITAVTLGISQRLATIALLDVSIGAQATANFFAPSLQDVYGTTPLSAQIYLRLTPTMFGMM